MKKQILIIGLIIGLILISGCVDVGDQDCFKEIAKDYCDSINESFRHTVSRITLDRMAFYCLDNNRQQIEYWFSSEEIDECSR